MRMALICLTIFSTFAFANNAQEPTFYEGRQRGWFWHEVEPEPEDEQEEQIPPPSSVSVQAEQQALNAEWLKENLEKLMQKAIDEPTQENLAAYAYANRLLLDMGSRFSTKMQEFMELEQPLQESARRPFSQFALAEFSEERNRVVQDIMSVLKSKTHLWFFYSSTCSFCVKQIPVLQELNVRTGLPILAISMDGGVLPGLENFEIVHDEGLRVSSLFGVRVTPTMHLVDNEKRQPIPLSEGLNSLPDLEKRILLVSKEAKFITDEQYQLARSVREISVFRNEQGEIRADKAKLNDDPGYLADLLRQRLEDIGQYGSTSANTSSPTQIQGTAVVR